MSIGVYAEYLQDDPVHIEFTNSPIRETPLIMLAAILDIK